ncbi:MAG: LLM class flavin-dependent oxidoreductase [Deltaproteobacteria bacterium]|nr:LLM class flavin-dependent oxidoreductase [Deltaproteobacteria bacterium]
MTDPLRLEEKYECGTLITAQDRTGVIALARRVESAGFDSLWVGDHVSFYVPMLESLTLLSFAAAATERVKLGTAVYLVPLRHPTTTAKVVATVDVLSGGRVVLGVGVGGEFPPEFEACGVPVEERGTRANEAIEVLRRLWSESNVTHAGRHFRFGPVSLDPKPLQRGGPPILVGGRKAPAFRRAGRLADGYISHMCSPEMYRENLEAIRRHAERAGRRDVPFQTIAFLFTRLGDDYEECLKSAAGTLQRVYNRPFEEAARKYCLLGRTDDCLEQMRAFARAGCRQFVLSPLMDGTEFLERAERDVLPFVRSIG